MLLTPSTTPGLEPELTPLPLGNLHPNPWAITPAAPGGPAVIAVDTGVGATAAAVAAAVAAFAAEPAARESDSARADSPRRGRADTAAAGERAPFVRSQSTGRRTPLSTTRCR